MSELSLLAFRGNIIVALHGEMTDSSVRNFQSHLLEEIEKMQARGLVIDISALEFVDSYMARVFVETAKMAQLMDTRTVLVGMKPEIAITLIQMGLSFEGVFTAVNLDRGLEILEKKRVRKQGRR